MEEITKIQRKHDGQIISFQTSSGRIISYQKALMEAQEGNLTGVSFGLDEDGMTHLSNSVDGDTGFSDLPEIF
ncbi:DUF3892 domain-containing protein [Rossellomorea vietnamensis]|uniref:DUF3892 domain-containing protein n=1 Tax=Rossellomorea vietnamensis TaxID=218284 RepID=A0A5D4P263_9BACI|nr:DUF3892 domain-containing protein [Rossellomorea vietnamensis]TYS18862.1 DUF3892 domain-containing protein [Rossellomorea vietnamensis]